MITVTGWIKASNFAVDMLQDLLINIRRGATKKRIHSKSFNFYVVLFHYGLLGSDKQVWC